jgi:phosphonate metabolism protein PhnN/1,5-bisphosphokinase (PRPP-forming)
MIVFVVGPSGAGKDSLLHYAETKLAGDPRFVFPRRVITREPSDESEDHDRMTPEEFAQAAERGEFALTWEAHGLHYGIPAAIDGELALGRTVAVNVSRNILSEAVKHYPHHLIAAIEAPAEILARRLLARGREDPADIAARVSRKVAAFPPRADVATIINDTTLENAGERFVDLLRAIQVRDDHRARALGMP